MSMVLRVEHGVLTLLGTAGAVSVQGAGTNVVTLVGSLDDLNNLLNGNLHYEPARDFWGEDNLTITTSDPGQHGAGGALTDTATVGITVTAEADEPAARPQDPRHPRPAKAWVPLNLSASVVSTRQPASCRFGSRTWAVPRWWTSTARAWAMPTTTATGCYPWITRCRSM